jgi:uncharacterized protein YoxC
MEGGALFNSGFLGASFNWWIGQIADDATWRDNILPGKFESANQIPGWGRRYKVRIIGLHDQGETEIASDQLPWAQVMYPVTAGGGQGGSGQTPNLRQGNMVFGFFLDGQEQQVPVIMGVLGNNAQTQLSTKTGDNRVTNTQPGSLATSGNAISASGDTDPNRKVPDDDKVSTKPTPPGTPSVAPKPGVVLDRFGRDPSRPPTRAELNAAQSARAEADRLGETGAIREARIANATVAATRQEAEAAASPAAPAVPGATKENADAVHLQSAADVKRLDLYLKKTVMLSPCDLPGSAMKGMQTDIENLTKEIDKILQAASSYVDAVSEVTSQISGIAGQVNNIAGQVGGIAGQVTNVVGQASDLAGSIGGIGDIAGSIDDTQEKIQALLEKYAPKIAKYMKIVFNKIFEYTSKKINAAIGPLSDIMFPNQRFQFLDMKIEINEKIKCLFSKITEGLGSQILGALKEILDKKNPSTNKTPTSSGTAPYVPICSVEELTGNLIAANMGDLDKTVGNVTKSVETFLNDIQGGLSVAGQVGGLLGGLGGVKIPDINGSIASALSFVNISLDLFGCDSKPNCAASDFYTLQEGAGAAEEAQLPRPAEVNEAAKDPGPVTPATTQPFAPPAKNTPDLKIGETNNETQAAAAEERRLAVQSLNLF